MNILKITKLALATAAIAFATTTSQAVVLLGTIQDGQPPSSGNEPVWTNFLLDQGLNTITVVDIPGDSTSDTKRVVRNGNADPGSGNVGAGTQGGSSTDGSVGAGFEYVSAKYSNVGLVVWYTGGAAFNVPLSYTFDALFPPNDPSSKLKGNLSHYTTYNRTNVPDGGATIALLGLGSLALAAVRRKA